MFGSKLILTKKYIKKYCDIPACRNLFLITSNGPPKGHFVGLNMNIVSLENGDIDIIEEVADDPSTIYLKIEAEYPRFDEEIPTLDFYPSYSGMTPVQRGKYLNWLCDIKKDIEIGYVFVYFYGLERLLVDGDFDATFNEICLLRKHHPDPSFLSYSSSSLMISSIMRNRLDKIPQLYDFKSFDRLGNLELLILYYNQQNLSLERMIQLAKKIYEKSRRYIKLYPELYKQRLSQKLINMFGEASYPLVKRFQLEDISTGFVLLYANTSLPEEVRSPPLPCFFSHPPFETEMSSIFQSVHETIKDELKQQRKKS